MRDFFKPRFNSFDIIALYAIGYIVGVTQDWRWLLLAAPCALASGIIQAALWGSE